MPPDDDEPRIGYFLRRVNKSPKAFAADVFPTDLGDGDHKVLLLSGMKELGVNPEIGQTDGRSGGHFADCGLATFGER